MEALLFGLNLLLLYALWRWVWRKTALDMHRDQLFDLRDEAKTFFIERGYGVTHPLYEPLRGLINAHIRYTEKLTFRLFFAESMAINTHPEHAQRIRATINDRFSGADPDLAAFIQKTRRRSISILNAHMVESSFGFLLLIPLLFAIVLAVKIYAYCMALVRHQNTQRIWCNAKSALRIAPIAGLFLAMPARAGLLHPGINSDLVEEYSYQAAQH